MLHLSLTDAPVLLGFICGGAVVYWFCGASMQAVTTGAYRAVEFIKKNMDLTKKEADIEDSKTVVRICTEYAQSGMWNIFIALMTLHAGLRLLRPELLRRLPDLHRRLRPVPGHLHGQRRRRLGQRQEVVEVDLKEKGTPLHAATVVGDTVGDPFKDTTSVALNPIIKFSTLFGLLAVEIAVHIEQAARRSSGSTTRLRRRRHAGDRAGVRVALVLRHAHSARRTRARQKLPEHGARRSHWTSGDTNVSRA